MRQWTVLVFMAADNDLDRGAVKDIHEMERVGSSDEVAIVVQVDRRGDGGDGAPRRGLVTRDPDWQPYKAVIASDLAIMDETNTGDPSVLTDFIVWGIQSYPAERYALVIWNHGSGWKPEFIYAAAEKSAGENVSVAMRASSFASQFVTQTRRFLFRRTLEHKIDRFIHQTLLPGLPELVAGGQPPSGGPLDLKDGIGRAIGLDETSHDALDCVELESAFDSAWARLEQAGHTRVRFAFLGFDACLMAGIEVAYQLRDVAHYIVGSEEIEPAVGWRYDLLLETLMRGGQPSSEESWADGMVDNYITGLVDYKVRLVTQSVVKTSAVSALATGIDALAALLVGKIGTHYGELARAEKTATRFFDTDYIDIGDYLDKIRSLDADPAYCAAWERVSASYRESVVYSRFGFPREGQRPTGLSFYYPTKAIFDDTYRSLDIAAAMPAWVEMIRRYHFLD